MLKYILKRIAYMFLVIWAVTTITFFLIHTIPGDPLTSAVQNLPEQTKINYYVKYGLDRPLYEQYFTFLKQIVTKFDLGESLRYPGRGVTKMIGKYSIISGKIGGISLLIGFGAGIIIGIIAALNRNKWPDYVAMFIAILGVTIPVFVTAAVLQYFFTVKYKLFPTNGWGGLKYMVLPIVCLSFGPVATYARYMRSSVLDVINQDYIVTAEAKGMSFAKVVQKHVLRNSILPALTILAPSIVNIFMGSFIVELIFAIPGLGNYFVTSINSRDYTMVLGNTMFYTTIYILALFIVDIVYCIIDPRISLIEK